MELKVQGIIQAPKSMTPSGSAVSIPSVDIWRPYMFECFHDLVGIAKLLQLALSEVNNDSVTICERALAQVLGRSSFVARHFPSG